MDHLIVTLHESEALEDLTYGIGDYTEEELADPYGVIDRYYAQGLELVRDMVAEAAGVLGEPTETNPEARVKARAGCCGTAPSRWDSRRQIRSARLRCVAAASGHHGVRPGALSGLCLEGGDQSPGSRSGPLQGPCQGALRARVCTWGRSD